MHARVKQVWTVGAEVNVGFIKGLKVVERIPTPGDYAPDCWALQSSGGQWYRFTPHKGIERCSSLEDCRDYC